MSWSGEDGRDLDVIVLGFADIVLRSGLISKHRQCQVVGQFRNSRSSRKLFRVFRVIRGSFFRVFRVFRVFRGLASIKP